MLSNFHILTVSHKEVALDTVPEYAIENHSEQALKVKLTQLKERCGLQEIFYLNTCNRVLYLFISHEQVDLDFITRFFESKDVAPVKQLHGEAAAFYFFQVASSVHSMVVGEREIITQIRTAYEQQRDWCLPGDNIRLLVQHTIRSAKKVYAATKIGEKPVSVVSLAIQKLVADFKISNTTPLVLVGAGTTNQLVLKHLAKRGFKNISIYNRSEAKAKTMALGLQGKTGNLDELANHSDDFGCVIACTGSPRPTVTLAIAEKITKGKIEEKIWIDLGLPADIDIEIHQKFKDKVINLQALQQTAKENLSVREKEIKKADEILEEALGFFKQTMYQRRIERAFKQIPSEIKEIKEKAITEVFKNDLNNLDSRSQEVISRMMSYMEKKCIGIPMKAAREAML